MKRGVIAKHLYAEVYVLIGLNYLRFWNFSVYFIMAIKPRTEAMINSTRI
jgi:hypothetical protein